MSKDKRRTLKLFLKEAPQRYFLVLQLGIFFATLVFLLYVITNIISGSMEKAYGLGLHSSDLDYIFDQMNSALINKISVLFLISYVINVLLGLFFLHRLTGPLVRIKDVVEELAKGNIPEKGFQLRKRDYPEDLARAFAKLITYLRAKK